MKKIFTLVVVGTFLIGCGQQEAKKTTEAPTPVSAESSEKYIQEGLQSLRDSDPTAAIRSFDEAIRSNPLDPRSYIILGQIYMRMNDYTRAIDTFSAATRIAPRQGQLYYLLAVNHGLKGDLELAKENVQKSLVLFKEQQDEENFKKSLALLQGLDQGPMVTEVIKNEALDNE